MAKYWREVNDLSVNAPARINIKGHIFIEHSSSVNERKDNWRTRKKEVPIRYAFWNGGILTEPQILEHLAMSQKAG